MACANIRVVMIILAFFAAFCSFIMRSCLSVTIVAMAGDGNQTNATSTIPLTKTQQGIALGAYFWGYTVPQIPGGLVVERFGARIVIMISMLSGGILSILSPVLAKQSWILLVVCRILLGVTQAVVYSSIQCFTGRWIPPREKSRAIPFSLMGTPLGTAVAFLIAGIMSDSIGWESLLGAFSFLFGIVWFFLSSSEPGMHRNISHKELNYIRDRQLSHGEIISEKPPTPWRFILRSIPVYSASFTLVTSTFTLYLSMTCLPQFMNDVVGFDIKSNGVYSALPYIVNAVTCASLALLGDRLIIAGLVSKAVYRKGASLIAGVGQSICCIVACYVANDSVPLSMAMLCISGMCAAFPYVGEVCVFQDMAAQYAGPIYGFANTFANVTGIIVPSIVAAMTPDKTQNQWQNVFYVNAAVAITGTLQFAVFGRTDVQVWAKGNNKVRPTPVQPECPTTYQIEGHQAHF